MVISKDVIFNENNMSCLSENNDEPSDSGSKEGFVFYERFQFKVEP